MNAGTTLDGLNAATEADFAAALDGVFEHAPWVAPRAAAARPFASVAALHAALMAVLRELPERERLRFLNGHPELTAGPLAAGLTAASQAEQGGSALALVPGVGELDGLQRLYRTRFGIPFIVCLRRHTPADVIRSLRRRLERAVEAEREAALDEVGHVSRLRLLGRLGADLSGALTVHVAGRRTGDPAEGVELTLAQEERPVGTWVTMADGSTAAPLLPGGALRIGQYALTVTAGAWFAAQGVSSPLESIGCRFRIEDPDRPLHLRVLLDPHAGDIRLVL